MYTTTDAIVLSLQPHSDKAHILHAYTRAGGRVNYMVYGLGKKNSSGKYTPLSIVQLTTDERSIRTAQLTFVPATITTNLYKQAIALFMAEILYHVLRHPMQDTPMFDFLEQAIRELDQTTEPQNFHLQFLVNFAAIFHGRILLTFLELSQDILQQDAFLKNLNQHFYFRRVGL